ncbi:hypothetical protein L249_0879 [Ophiocordyceps polyrhachis-furcata BCC 54312]|uniref:Uncharacterized protein n=1 Tax=Ophiocordyceps polyrhachis-furcata BCC 54312 TaxID=1330021 RepID=A0A367LE20_9HYPO|nr:hypothetical protein L249_0879 [Ophiocordyceps polyrhachis-furcata BCC 54312]
MEDLPSFPTVRIRDKTLDVIDSFARLPSSFIMFSSLGPWLKLVAALSHQTIQPVLSVSTTDTKEGISGNAYASNRWRSTFYTEIVDDQGPPSRIIPIIERKPDFPVRAVREGTDVHTPHGESWVLEPARKGDWKATSPPRIGGYDNIRTGPASIGPVKKSLFGTLCRFPSILMFRTFHHGRPMFNIYVTEHGEPELLVSGLFSCGLIGPQDIVDTCRIPNHRCVKESGSLIDVRPGFYSGRSASFDQIPIAACDEFRLGPPSAKHNLVCTRIETYQGSKYTHIYWCMMRTEYKATDCIWHNVARKSWPSSGNGLGRIIQPWGKYYVMFFFSETEKAGYLHIQLQRRNESVGPPEDVDDLRNCLGPSYAILVAA